MITVTPRGKVLINDKLIGLVKGNSLVVFKKKNHFFKDFNGYAVNEQMLHIAMQKGCCRLKMIVKTDDGETLFDTNLNDWMMGSVFVNMMMGGPERQRILPLEKMLAGMIKK